MRELTSPDVVLVHPGLPAETVRALLPAWVPRPGPEGVLDSLFFWHRSVPLDQRALLQMSWDKTERIRRSM